MCTCVYTWDPNRLYCAVSGVCVEAGVAARLLNPGRRALLSSATLRPFPSIILFLHSFCLLKNDSRGEFGLLGPWIWKENIKWVKRPHHLMRKGSLGSVLHSNKQCPITRRRVSSRRLDTASQKLFPPDICFQSKASSRLFPLRRLAIIELTYVCRSRPQEKIPPSVFCPPRSDFVALFLTSLSSVCPSHLKVFIAAEFNEFVCAKYTKCWSESMKGAISLTTLFWCVQLVKSEYSKILLYHRRWTFFLFLSGFLPAFSLSLPYLLWRSRLWRLPFLLSFYFCFSFCLPILFPLGPSFRIGWDATWRGCSLHRFYMYRPLLRETTFSYEQKVTGIKKTWQKYECFFIQPNEVVTFALTMRKVMFWSPCIYLLPSHWKCGRLCFDRRVFIYLFVCVLFT